MTIAPPLKVVRSIIHGLYYFGDQGLMVGVNGVSTAIIASRFRAGESIMALADDYHITADSVLAALRFELYGRAVRVRAVRAEALRLGLGSKVAG